MAEHLNRSQIEDLVNYSNEGESLDFKSAHYKREQFPELLKDIIAMANSSTKDDKYIILGVKFNTDGSREILGINDPPDDEAIYQQLVRENIEPELKIQYIPFEMEGKQLMILSISDCNDKPYMMKKDYQVQKKGLKKGDSFIRKGSHQPRLSRNDIDRMYNEKNKEKELTGDNLSIYFSNGETSITIPASTEITLPSEQYKAEIVQLIELIKANGPVSPLDGVPPRKFYQPDAALYTFNLAQLESDLQMGTDVYSAEDYKYKFDENGFKLNFTARNDGTDYVKDASVQVIIPRVEGLEITTNRNFGNFAPTLISTYLGQDPLPGEYNSWNPSLTGYADYFVLAQDLGDLKHYIPRHLFKTPVTLFLPKCTEGKSLQIICKLFGQNLKSPIIKKLTLNITKY